MKKLHFATPLALMVVLGGVISGCTVGAGQQLTASDILQKMRDTVKTTTSVQGSVDLNLTINKDGLKTLVQGFMGNAGGTGGAGMMGDTGKGGMMAGKALDFSKLPDSASATINYWHQADKFRVDVVTASFPEIKGSSLVSDGQKVYALDAPNKTVYTVTPGKFADKIPAEMKTMLAGIDPQKVADSVISATNISLLGTEKVAGLDAYKLDVTVKPDAATILGVPQQYAMPVGVLIKDLHAVLYVDTNRFVPLKFTLEHPQMGSFTYSATTLDVNKAIDASTFVLQVPSGYKTVDLDQKAADMAPTSMTLPNAKAAAQKDGWTLLEPSYLPSGATLVGVTQMQRAMGGGFMLSYSAPSTDFTIMQGKSDKLTMLGFDNYAGTNGKDTETAQLVTVRGVQAKAFTTANSGWTALIWQEKDTHVWVALTGKLSTDEAVKIAESLK